MKRTADAGDTLGASVFALARAEQARRPRLLQDSRRDDFAVTIGVWRT